jgi:UDP-N-acetylmuramate--alanine ligase
MDNGRLKIFFSGIGGSGVSAIAGFMADKGHTVAGSDRAFDANPGHPAYGALKRKGIKIVPQDGRGIDPSYDFAVFSTAVEDDRPEAVRARELNVPVKTRPEFLVEIVSSYETTAVAGTSGKSTASGLLAFLMERLGLGPNFIGGGRVRQFTSGSGSGNSIAGNSRSLVVEACESDGSIVNYRPSHCILLNLALDHHSVERTAEMFRTLIDNTGGLVVLNADDKNLKGLGAKEAVTFSIDAPSSYRASDVVLDPFGSSFTLNGTRFALPMPGRHNLLNSLACLALLSEWSIKLENIAPHLAEFGGIERRFDVIMDNGRGLVIDDYAHNPHKIAALMRTVSNARERVCYIFQPHGFGPTRLMKDGYIRAFSENLRGSDHLLILPIYYAGGSVSRDISSEALAEGVLASGSSAEAVTDRETVLGRVEEWDAFVVVGARDETLADFARQIAALKSATTGSA